MYYCEFCDYETEDRDRIHYHHIKPKGMKGSDKAFNRVYCCKICHSKIFVEGSWGIHGIPSEHSIIINGKFLSTGGMIVDFIKSGEQHYSILKNS